MVHSVIGIAEQMRQYKQRDSVHLHNLHMQQLSNMGSCSSAAPRCAGLTRVAGAQWR